MASGRSEWKLKEAYRAEVPAEVGGVVQCDEAICVCKATEIEGELLPSHRDWQVGVLIFLDDILRDGSKVLEVVLGCATSKRLGKHLSGAEKVFKIENYLK